MNAANYTQLQLSRWRSQLKSVGKVLNEDTLWESLRLLQRTFVSRLVMKEAGVENPGESSTLMQLQLAQIETGMVASALNRKSRHLFLAPGLARFLVDCAKEPTPDFFRVLPECPFVKSPGGKLELGVFIIHFPRGEMFDRSIIVAPNLPSYDCHDMRKMTCAVALMDGVDIIHTGSEASIMPGADEEQLNKARLVFGLSLYLDAFPETVRKAVDGEIAHPSWFKGDRMIVEANATVSEEERGSITPHWRRGHFNVLKSERFVHRRWQSVWIRGHMVKGKAYEILDDTPPQQQADNQENTR